MTKPKILEQKLGEPFGTKSSFPLKIEDFSVPNPRKGIQGFSKEERYYLPKPDKDLVIMSDKEYHSYLKAVREEMAAQGFSKNLINNAENFVENIRHPVYLKKKLTGPPENPKLQLSLEVVYNKDGKPTKYGLEVDKNIIHFDKKQYQNYFTEVKGKLREQGIPEEYDKLVEGVISRNRHRLAILYQLEPRIQPLFTEEKLREELKTVEEAKEFLEGLKREGGEGLRKAVEQTLEKIGAEEKKYQTYVAQVTKGPRLEIKIPKSGSVTGEIVNQVETLTGKRLRPEEVRSLFYEAILPDNPDLKPPGKPGIVKGEWSPQTGWDYVLPGQEFSFTLGPKTRKWLEEHELSSLLSKLEKPLPIERKGPLREKVPPEAPPEEVERKEPTKPGKKLPPEGAGEVEIPLTKPRKKLEAIPPEETGRKRPIEWSLRPPPEAQTPAKEPLSISEKEVFKYDEKAIQSFAAGTKINNLEDLEKNSYFQKAPDTQTKEAIRQEVVRHQLRVPGLAPLIYIPPENRISWQEIDWQALDKEYGSFKEVPLNQFLDKYGAELTQETVLKWAVENNRVGKEHFEAFEKLCRTGNYHLVAEELPRNSKPERWLREVGKVKNPEQLAHVMRSIEWGNWRKVASFGEWAMPFPAPFESGIAYVQEKNSKAARRFVIDTAVQTTIFGAGVLIGGLIGSAVAPGPGTAAGAASGGVLARYLSRIGARISARLARRGAAEAAEAAAKKVGAELAEKAVEEVGERVVREAAEEVVEKGAREAAEAVPKVFRRFEATIAPRLGSQGEVLGKEVLVKMPGFADDIRIPTEMLANTVEAQTKFRSFYDNLLREVLADRAAARGMELKGLGSAALDQLLAEEWQTLDKAVQKGLTQFGAMQVIGQEGIEEMLAKAGGRGVKDFTKPAEKIVRAREVQRIAEEKALRKETKRRAKQEAAEALAKGRKVRLIDRIKVGAKTDRGLNPKRPVNEDFFAHPSWAKTAYGLPEQTFDLRGALYVVADGMGGHQAGEVASREAVDQLYKAYYHSADFKDPTIVLREAFDQANREVYYLAQNPQYKGMGTTLTGGVIKDGELIIGHVGDSRAYLVRGRKIKQLTADHSWVAEQVRKGVLTEAEARAHEAKNVITRAIGSKPVERIDIVRQSLRKGDKIIFTTDGLTNLVSDKEIYHFVSRFKPQEATEQLIKLANQRGGLDNITALVVEFGG